MLSLAGTDELPQSAGLARTGFWTKLLVSESLWTEPEYVGGLLFEVLTYCNFRNVKKNESVSKTRSTARDTLATAAF